MGKNIFPFKISDNQSYSTAKTQQHKSNRAKTYRQSDNLLLESLFTFGRDAHFLNSGDALPKKPKKNATSF
jgi:hypothetical protein